MEGVDQAKGIPNIASRCPPMSPPHTDALPQHVGVQGRLFRAGGVIAESQFTATHAYRRVSANTRATRHTASNRVPFAIPYDLRPRHAQERRRMHFYTQSSAKSSHRVRQISITRELKDQTHLKTPQSRHPSPHHPITHPLLHLNKSHISSSETTEQRYPRQ